MAGDWIKLEKTTPDKPEISILARKLGVSQAEAFLAVTRLLIWADGHVSCPGFVPHLSLKDGDTHTRLSGTCAALASPEIGWLIEENGGFRFVHFDRHNGKSAKERALEAEKKRRQRGELSRKCPDENGTKTGPEKRREEKSKNTPLPPKGGWRVFLKAAEEVYSMYPRKVGKPGALKAIAKAIAKHGAPRIAERTKTYAAARAGQDPQFTPHPATWFNGERFNDDPETWVTGNGTSQLATNAPQEPKLW